MKPAAGAVVPGVATAAESVGETTAELTEPVTETLRPAVSTVVETTPILDTATGLSAPAADVVSPAVEAPAREAVGAVADAGAPETGPLVEPVTSIGGRVSESAAGLHGRFRCPVARGR